MTTSASLPVSSTPAHLPDDPAVLKDMIVELLHTLRQSQQESAQLRARLDQLLRRLYGPRAERFDPSQPLLFPELPGTAETTTAAPAPPAPPDKATGEKRQRRPGHGRQELPSHLPRERRVYALTEAERLCPCCGKLRPVLSEEVSEQLEYVPASLFVIEHVRLRYACLDCEQQRTTAASSAAATTAAAVPQTPAEPGPGDAASLPVTAPASDSVLATVADQGAAASTFVTAPRPAAPIPRGLPGPGLLAYVIVSKYCDHLPLYRLERMFAREGASVTRQTQSGWLTACAGLLQPLYQLMRERIWLGWVVGSDDTPVAVLEPGRGQTRQGRVWVYVGDLFFPYLVYDFTPNREQEGPQQFLAEYRGYFQADAYAGYDALYKTGQLIEVACWAHVRRKFFDAQKTDPERALYALGVIRRLYAVERQADEEIARRRLSREEGWSLRLRLRHEQSLPVLNRFGDWLRQERENVLPKSPIGEALGYACNLWSALIRYTTQGYLAIDNNAAERALRAIAVGRKNYLFFGSDVGGETAAVLYTFVQTCQRLEIEPWRYLRDVLERLPSCPPEQLEELLPDRWAAAQRTRAEREAVEQRPKEDGRAPPPG